MVHSNFSWSEAKFPEKGNVLKWKNGKNRVRFFGPLASYEKKWPNETRTETAVMCIDLDDQNKVKVAVLKKAIIKTVSAYQNEHNIDPSGQDAHAFCVTRDGTGMDCSYSVLPSLKIVPLSSFPGLDLAKEAKALSDFVASQEKTSASARSEPLNQPKSGQSPSTSQNIQKPVVDDSLAF